MTPLQAGHPADRLLDQADARSAGQLSGPLIGQDDEPGERAQDLADPERDEEQQEQRRRRSCGATILAR